MEQKPVCKVLNPCAEDHHHLCFQSNPPHQLELLGEESVAEQYIVQTKTIIIHFFD